MFGGLIGHDAPAPGVLKVALCGWQGHGGPRQVHRATAPRQASAWGAPRADLANV